MLEAAAPKNTAINDEPTDMSISMDDSLANLEVSLIKKPISEDRIRVIVITVCISNRVTSDLDAYKTIVQQIKNIQT